jgi:hypothetical protein
MAPILTLASFQDHPEETLALNFIIGECIWVH